MFYVAPHLARRNITYASRLPATSKTLVVDSISRSNQVKSHHTIPPISESGTTTFVLDETVARYITLEMKVNGAVTNACKPTCRTCTECCCAIRFCAEAVESQWLKMVAARAGHQLGDYHDRSGWLTPSGCQLTVGRPPVCYEFFCDAILRAEESVPRRHALRVLGRLVGFVGRNALGGRHLVTLTANETQRLDCDRLRTRLMSAEEVFTDCMEILTTGTGTYTRLRRVMALPKELEH